MTDLATAFNIFDPVFKADPYPTYRQLRAEHPVIIDQHAPICWLFRHADCEEALRDPRLGSPLGSPEVLARKLGDGAAACYIGTSMLAQNPPEHTRLRRAVSKAFTAKAVEAMRDQTVAKVNGLLDEVTAGGRKEFDLANEVAYRIPISVVCGMLGVPVEHHDRFRALIEENAAVVEPMPTPEQVVMADKASGELMDLVSGLAAERRVEPRDDLLSVLVAHQGDETGLTDLELVANVSLLIAAGFCSTMQLIGNTIYELLRHPDQLDLVRADPAAVAAAPDLRRRHPPLSRRSPRPHGGRTGRTDDRDPLPGPTAGERQHRVARQLQRPGPEGTPGRYLGALTSGAGGTTHRCRPAARRRVRRRWRRCPSCGVATG
ncbi:MAG: cytochrome P450 [Actinobacteria bacterium]|nr:cytochrome P450 [Actinomycetota bacterium]